MYGLIFLSISCVLLLVVLYMKSNREQLLEDMVSSLKCDNEKLTKKQSYLYSNISELLDEVTSIRKKNKLLENELKFYLEEDKRHRFVYNKKIYIDDEILEAIKVARNLSHPDKGNFTNSDNFIKFDKLYKKHKEGV